MNVKTVPLSLALDPVYLESISDLHDKIYPIGLGYKKYLEKNKPDLTNYVLIINTHDEVNIHFIKNHSLVISESILMKNYSLESLLNDIDNGSQILISKIIDVQLNELLTRIRAKDQSVLDSGKIIYLENTTNYMNYLNKKDQLILTDRTWKIHEDEFIASCLDD
jgi:hypothetical protein